MSELKITIQDFENFIACKTAYFSIRRFYYSEKFFNDDANNFEVVFHDIVRSSDINDVKIGINILRKNDDFVEKSSFSNALYSSKFLNSRA